MMLTFRHYEFKQRLQWKAWQRGALVLDVNEAYTSKTRSWDGTVHLHTLQRRVQQWRGIMAKKLVYATAGEPMAEPAAMPELALVGRDPRC